MNFISKKISINLILEPSVARGNETKALLLSLFKAFYFYLKEIFGDNIVLLQNYFQVAILDHGLISRRSTDKVPARSASTDEADLLE